MSKNKKQPQRVNTFARTLAWIVKNVGVERLKHDGHESARAAAMWFFAMREVDSGAWADMKRKDMAHVILNGLGKLTVKGINEGLWDERTNGPDTELSVEMYDLTDELEAFWFDRRSGKENVA